MRSSETIEFQSAAWGPARLAREDLEALSDFTGLTPDDCIRRLNAYSLEEMAAAWRERSPATAAEIRSFYSDTDHYLWELLGWHGSGNYEPYLRRLERLRERWPPSMHPRALDYGAGIGTAALVLAQYGYQVTIADVPGPTLGFAKARLARRGIPFEALEIVEDSPPLPARRWNVIVCFDVLEHVPDPGQVACTLVSALRPGGAAAIVASFDVGDDAFPHHLPAGRREFGGYRWGVYVRGLGLKHVGDSVYRKVGPVGRAARRGYYEFSRVTGFRLHPLARRLVHGVRRLGSRA